MPRRRSCGPALALVLRPRLAPQHRLQPVLGRPGGRPPGPRPPAPRPACSSSRARAATPSTTRSWAPQVVAVDANPRQNHLLELKRAGIAALDFEAFFALFGEGGSRAVPGHLRGAAPRAAATTRARSGTGRSTSSSRGRRAAAASTTRARRASWPGSWPSTSITCPAGAISSTACWPRRASRSRSPSTKPSCAPRLLGEGLLRAVGQPRRCWRCWACPDRSGRWS